MENQSEKDEVVKLLEQQVRQNEERRANDLSELAVKVLSPIGAVILFAILARWISS